MKTKYRKAWFLSVIIGSGFMLSACLSSGSGDNVEPDSPNVGTAVGSSNHAPTISGSPPAQAKIGDTYLFAPSAADQDGDTLTFSIQNMPSWATFDAGTGKLLGTPRVADEGTYENVKISVSDGSAEASLPGYSITVVVTADKSVTLSWTPPTQNADGSNLVNLSAYRLYYGTSSSNYTQQQVIDNPGITTYVVGNLLPGTYYFVATAINANGDESDFSNEIVKEAT